ENPKDTFIFPDDITEEHENNYKKEILDALIKKEVSMEEVKFNSNYDIYGFPDAKKFENDHPEPKIINFEDPKVQIKNFAEISEFITCEPRDLQINDKPIGIPTMTLFNVKNTMNENLILRSMKSDLYQVTIFYFRP